MRTPISRTGSKVLLFLAVCIAIQPPIIYAQSETEDEELESSALDEPVPYDPLEFPAWSRDLRRAEIIALGSFPITMLLAGFSYQLGRFGYRSYLAGEADTDYAPWFFSTSTEPRYTNDERIGLIVSAVVLSVGIAFLDFALGRREERRERERSESGDG